MRCEQASRLLVLQAGSDVDPEEGDRLSLHLEDCPRCRGELDEHRACRSLLATRRPALPAGFWDGWAEGVAARALAERSGSENRTEEGPRALPAPSRPELPDAFWDGYTGEVLARLRPAAARPAWIRAVETALAASVLAAAALVWTAAKDPSPPAGVQIARGVEPVLAPTPSRKVEEAPVARVFHLESGTAVRPAGREFAGVIENISPVGAAGRREAQYRIDQAIVPDEKPRSLSF